MGWLAANWGWALLGAGIVVLLIVGAVRHERDRREVRSRWATWRDEPFDPDEIRRSRDDPSWHE